jgi:hypothetical protein
MKSPRPLDPTERQKGRSVHHHRGRAAGIALGSYYCGSSPCFRIYPPRIYGFAAPVPGIVAPLYRESTVWWPSYYDYAPGQWGRGFPRYGGYGRRAISRRLKAMTEVQVFCPGPMTGAPVAGVGIEVK